MDHQTLTYTPNGRLGKGTACGSQGDQPRQAHAGVCEHTRVHLQISSHASTDWPPSPNRRCPGSVRSPSCRSCVPAPGRILAPASPALIRFWGQLSMELTGDLGECHSVTEVPASQSIPRKEAPLKRCRASPGTSPLQQKGAHSQASPPGKGVPGQGPSCHHQGISAVEGIGSALSTETTMLNRKSVPHSSVEASNHTPRP